jgi:PAS domain S-box-containing protein
MQSELSIQESQLNNIFPFYISINREGIITGAGKSLQKIYDHLIGADFFSLFNITRPFIELQNYPTLKKLYGQLIVVDSVENEEKKISLRGQIELIKFGKELLFIGSPWFQTIEEVINAGLTIHDFAHHDTLTDMLHILKTQEITNQDLKHLLETINKQKNELKLANKAIHDIALFPQQNPDPLIRINFEGEILQNNPAASKLDFMEFEGKLYRNDHFFKLLAGKIDFSKKRTEFYGNYEGVDYSFVCIPMEEEKYINIYGRDITEKKQIEQHVEEQRRFYEGILDNLPADIAVLDKEHKYLFVNPMAVKSEEMRMWLIGKTDFDYVKEKNKPESIAINRRNIFNEILETKKLKSWEEETNAPDGSKRYILRNMYPVQDKDGNIESMIGYGIDITDRIKAELELKEAKKITEELAESKQNFLANMSHEIRTPLNAILGMAHQLEKTNLSTDQTFYLEIIRSASDNLLIVINDILDLSKMEAGKLSIEKIGFEPRVVLNRALQVMRHKAEEKGLALIAKSCDTKLEQILIGDPYRLNQIILNLLSNSIKFTEKGSIEISCQVLKNNENSQLVRLLVADTGVGMEAQFTKKIFHKFSQEDETVTRKYGGTGLGMSITRELVELMNGKIYVESEKNKGTTIYFDIEFEKGTEDVLAKKSTTPEDTSILQNKTILVADDNKMNRVVAGAILKNYHCEIIYAENGLDAIAKTKSHQPDVILMDVQMPEMDGLQATKEIRENISKTTPIIALTALAIRGDKEKCKQAGMNDYLSKPFEETVLINMMCRWLNKSKVKSKKSEPKKSKNTDKLYSLSGLENIARGDRSFIIEMVQIFIEQSHVSIEQIKDAFAKSDLGSIKKIAHRLKPAIDNLDIQLLKSLIRELESEKLYSDNILKEKVELLESTLSKVIDQLNLEFSL